MTAPDEGFFENVLKGLQLTFSAQAKMDQVNAG